MPQRYLHPGRVVRIVLVLLFIVLPILEVLTIVAMSRLIGGWPTFGLILLGTVAGAWIVRRQGRRSWQTLRQAAEDVPLQPDAIGSRPRQQARPLADGGLVLAGGVLLMVPGFLTDVLGLLFLLPVTRPIARVSLAYLIGRRVSGTVQRFSAQSWESTGTWSGPGGPNAPGGWTDPRTTTDPRTPKDPGTPKGPGGPSGPSGAGGATVRGDVIE